MGTQQRLYPSPAVATAFLEWCDQGRFLYNLSVEQFEFAARYRGFAAHPNEAVKSRQHWPSPAERARQLAELRAELDWLRSGPSAVQQQAIRVVDRAYANWFKNPGHFRRPGFRARAHHGGFGIAGVDYNFNLQKINRRRAQIRLLKVGWVKFRLSVPWPRVEEAKSCRVIIDRVGRWHVSFPSPQPVLFRTPTGATVGIDRGVTNTFATSDGGVEHVPTLRPKEAERVLRLERIARQAKGSKRRERTRVAKAKIIARGTDRRTDWIEQTTTYLVREYDLIALENLAIKNMTRSAKGTVQSPGKNVAAKSGLNRAILDANWGKFEQRLRDKASTCGVRVISVPARNTSRRCVACGHTSAQNRESQSVFACRVCGLAGTRRTPTRITEHPRACSGDVWIGRGKSGHSAGRLVVRRAKQ